MCGALLLGSFFKPGVVRLWKEQHLQLKQRKVSQLKGVEDILCTPDRFGYSLQSAL